MFHVKPHLPRRSNAASRNLVHVLAGSKLPRIESIWSVMPPADVSA